MTTAAELKLKTKQTVDAEAQKIAVRGAASAVKALLERLHRIPGFREFFGDMGIRAQLCSTPGWQNGVQNEVQTDLGPIGAPVETCPGAKPIGMQQWIDAAIAAGLITEAVPGARLPRADGRPDGTITLTWDLAPSEMQLQSDGLTLTMSASLVANIYQWVQRIDGTERRFQSSDPQEVMASLTAVIRSAKAKQLVGKVAV